MARLFKDTVTGLGRLPTSPNSLRFLGTIIAVNDKALLGVAEPMDQQLPETVMTLIDGQQRLCTLITVNILLHDKIDASRSISRPRMRPMAWDRSLATTCTIW
ncbi:hypothetical protein ACVWYO_001241 [Sphingomonas sp. UYP23]